MSEDDHGVDVGEHPELNTADDEQDVPEEAERENPDRHRDEEPFES